MNFSGISAKSLIGRLLCLPLWLVPDGLVGRIMQGPLKGKRRITGSSTHGCWGEKATTDIDFDLLLIVEKKIEEGVVRIKHLL